MKQRLNFFALAPDLGNKLVALSTFSRENTLGDTLIDLVNTRASQLNGCTYCVDIHVKEGKLHGERELRLYHVPVWRESTLFSERERAALLFTEELTQVTYKGISDGIYGKVKEHFSDKEIVDLTFVISLINVWNRLNVTFHSVHGSLDKMMGLDKANLS